MTAAAYIEKPHEEIVRLRKQVDRLKNRLAVQSVAFKVTEAATIAEQRERIRELEEALREMTEAIEVSGSGPWMRSRVDGRTLVARARAALAGKDKT